MLPLTVARRQRLRNACLGAGWLVLALLGTASLSAAAEAFREPKRLVGHQKIVWWVTFSADGRTLVSVDHLGTVKFWDVATGTPRGSFQAHDGHIRAAVLTPDGKTLASVGGVDFEHGEAKLWDVVEKKEGITLKERAPLAGHTRTVLCVALAPGGRALATGSWDHTVKLWDVASGKELLILRGHTGLVHAVAFSPDGRVLASAGWDGVIRLWDVATGRERAAYRVHADERIHGMAFSPDGRTIASASMDRMVKVWEVASGMERAAYRAPAGFVVCLAFSPDGRTLVGGGDRGSVSFWDLATGTGQTVHGRHTDSIRGVAFHPDGRLLASGGGDAAVLLWDDKAMPPAPKAVGVVLDEGQLEAAWAALAGADGALAGRAVWTLAGVPRQSVPFLEARLRPREGPLPRPIDRLLADLDHDDFDARDRATAELARLGERAEPALRKLLEGRPSPETRQRVGRLLEELDNLTVSTARAVEVLEHVGTPEARRVLEALARGPAGRRATGLAKAVLESLARRSSRGP
jgi:hypothetical protein